MSSVILTSAEKEIVFEIAEKITGTYQQGKYRREVLAANVVRRIVAAGFDNLEEYLHYAWSNNSEMEELISALTIHTTHWFRENNHFDRLEEILASEGLNFGGEKFKLLSAASSTGEEAYSFGMVLENFRRNIPGFDYEILVRDIDPICVGRAKRGIYKINDDFSKIGEKYKKFILKGSGKTEGFFTIDKEIRKRTRFEVRSLTNPGNGVEELFDWVVCRNVLIYFKPSDVHAIVQRLLTMMKPTGMLVLGSSEAIDPKKFELVGLGASSYVNDVISMNSINSRRRILVVDDSTTIRATMTNILSPYFKVVTAESADQASEYLKLNKVDLITLDLNMPGKDGATWLMQQRRQGMSTPVIIVSGASQSEVYSVLKLLGDGAQDCMNKEELENDPEEIAERFSALIDGHVNRQMMKHKPGLKTVKKGFAMKPKYPDVILLGASTGGTEALCTLLKNLSRSTPPVLVVQHIQPGFAKGFAERLAQASGLKLGEPREGTPLEPGHLYMAFDDYHIGVKKAGANLVLDVSNFEQINRYRPSIDYLFNSAYELKINIMAVLLTGMGVDGTKGLLRIKQAGGSTIVQNEASSIVFNLPKEAIRLGAAGFIGDPIEIRTEIDRVLFDPANISKRRRSA